ncbi:MULTISPECIES: hypothetical protein [unclassified Pseudomonas]|uniref:hypothetical protein n=1 Tax=unclassified Pseudomonas TaxID=196821 RepID=UPI002AC96344|nr:MULTISPECIES: hypothetical protein [unclassified Pseudomonas]MEB0076267.1 hypothetical protein [Pseudomonas sp. MH10out]MEB0041329.1 hypothetical protein [Pseudomonas sp. MH10]MEB0100560.1 hypothetical protein [Pseudomonas sp. CCI3.2]MEB0121382.1 hypothetical protein [Pseudomonas sp. CCI1.2]MEB0131938.1 hypothetical protein [Pseudomonas sp. CCI2.4]
MVCRSQRVGEAVVQAYGPLATVGSTDLCIARTGESRLDCEEARHRAADDDLNLLRLQ